MGRQTAFAFLLNNNLLYVDYYFMGDYALGDIETCLHESYDVVYDCARPLFEGRCLLSEFKSPTFAEQHDLVGAALIMRESIICYKEKTIIVYRRR